MEKRVNILTGFSIIVSLVTGIASLVVAIFALINADRTGAGIALVAAALAFGLLLNALLRQ
jgi:hypothetical protein